MTKHKISDLLDELRSKEAYIRSDAIKKIIKGKTNDEHIIHALNHVIENDPSMSLRNFARSALDVFGIEHSAIEEPAKIIPVIDSGTPKKADPVEIDHLAVFRIIWGVYILAFFPACFCATQAGYIFDGGDTPENQMLYWVLVSFPITILISIAGSWTFQGANKFTATVLMLLLPLIHFFMILLLDQILQ
jgi:hypothetical protein